MAERADVHYTLTDATSEDTAWLETLRRSVYQELFFLTWGGWDEARHQRHFAEFLELGCTSIISIDGSAVGIVQLFEHDDGLDRGEIQIMPTHQNLGIGTQVLKDIILRSARTQKDLRLSVGLKNQKARRLYERLGFVVEVVSETHYHMLRFPGPVSGEL